MEEYREFWNSRSVLGQQIKKKNMFSLFHNVFISIDAEFQSKSIDVHYLWVLLLSLSIINQKNFH
jgi:hypothetical protein